MIVRRLDRGNHLGEILVITPTFRPVKFFTSAKSRCFYIHFAETDDYDNQFTGKKGIQIDLLIDRNDKVINVFEIKFHDAVFSLTESYAQTLREKLRVFREATQTRKYLMLTMITTYGLKHNAHSLGLVEKVVALEELFVG